MRRPAESVLFAGRNWRMGEHNSPRHVVVYHEPGKYAGWPANQGMWSWGNELLVGFVLGNHAAKRADWKYGHPIDQTKVQEHVYSRSFDGGLSWSEPEFGIRAGRTCRTYDHFVELPDVPRMLEEPMDFREEGFALSFARLTNHTGPTCFYSTFDRGLRWDGPFSFPDLGTFGVASRTDYLVLDDRSLVAMLTVAKPDGREGQALCARTDDGGLRWEAKGYLGEVPEVKGYRIMPSTVRLGRRWLYSVVRRCGANPCGRRDHWLESYSSEDIGVSWKRMPNPVDDMGKGGSPAALLRLLDGRLLVAYVVRSKSRGVPSRLCVKLSGDGMMTWGNEIVLRDDGRGWDLGYPRAVQRSDGRVVIAYYWADRERWPDRWIGATIWSPLK